ncbi:MAG: SpoIIE family protein phosphatase [Halioglobus sp.]
MSNSITTRLITVLSLGLALVLGAGMALDYRLSRDEILERLQLEATDSVTAAVTDLENWLQAVEGTTVFLGRVLQQREYSQTGLQQLLKDIVEENDDIFGATIALNPSLLEDANGFAPYYFRRDSFIEYADLSEQRYWEQPWYTEAAAAQQPIWVEPYFDAGGGNVLMTTFSVPVFRLDESRQRFLYAVVTADVSLDELHRYLQRLRLGSNGFGILLSRGGIILSSPNPDSIMKHHLEVAENAFDINAWSATFDAALQGQTPNRKIECPHLFGQCMIRLTALKSTGWPVGVIYSEDDILAPLYEYQRKTALLGLFTLIIMALLISVVTRRLTRPLTALAQVTDQIAQGSLDVPLPRIQGKDEVARLIAAFAEMKRNLRIYIDDLELATAARSRLEGELATARQIQMAMLPQEGEAHETTDDLEYWATVKPAKSVGGDLYTYFYDSAEKLHFCVGDVSDKGVPAALFMARTLSHIQQFSDLFTDPGAGMAVLNNALVTGNSNCMFVTLFYGVLDRENGQLIFASAGHTPPSLLRSDTASAILQDSGPALGLVDDVKYPTNTLQLSTGDRLAIYTDGIDEAFNPRNEMFGTERLDQALELTSNKPPAEAGHDILAAISAFTGDAPQSDDICLMLVDITGKVMANQHDNIHASFSPGERLVSRVCDWLEQVLVPFSLEPATQLELVLVCEEVVSNIKKYAGLTDDDKIEIDLLPTATNITLTFSDPGIAFNPLGDTTGAELGRDIETAEIGGLGVHLISQLTEQQSYQRQNDCNVLQLIRNLS